MLKRYGQDNLWGFKSRDGTIIWEPVFDRVGRPQAGLIPVRRNKLWGALNNKGELQIPNQFFRELYFEGALAQAQDEHGLHLIDRSGRILADLGETLLDHGGGPCRWVYLKDGSVSLFNFRSGAEVPTNYADVRPYSENLSAVAQHALSGDRLLWGFIDRNGELAIPCVYDTVEDFGGGRALVSREHVWQIIDPSGAVIEETLWSLADDAPTSDTHARQGCLLITITDTLTGEVWQRDCGPVSLAFRPALLIGSAAHCHVRAPGLPPVAAVVQEVPTEDILCNGYRISVTCDKDWGRWRFLWEQVEFPIQLELSESEYAVLQQGREPEFLGTSWRMEGDVLFFSRQEDFARVSFRKTTTGWAAVKGWTSVEMRDYCETSVCRMIQAAVRERPRTRP